MSESITIAYGPRHAEELFTFLGVSRDEFRAAGIVDSRVYFEPYLEVKRLPDGRVAKLATCKDGYYTRVVIYPDAAAYQQAKEAEYADMPDPETGRRR